MNATRRLRWIMNTFADVWTLQRRLAICPGELVLDVGSGGHPNLRANVLCDKFIADGAERHGTAVVSDRPFVVGDINRLPFADKAFDYVICSHLLEHVRDPATAIAELQRVGHRGYIETPSAEWEKLVGFPFHRWLVSRRNDCLIFQRKRAPLEDEALRSWFAYFQKQLRLGDTVWLARRRLGVYTWLLWEREIEFEIVEAERADSDESFIAAELTDDEQQNLPEVDAGLATRVLALIGRRSRRDSNPTPDQLDALLRCPTCYGTLQRRESIYRCRRCPKSYPIDGANRPWLVIERAGG